MRMVHRETDRAGEARFLDGRRLLGPATRDLV